MSEMMHPRPCSCRFSEFGWLEMSHINATSHRNFISNFCIFFPFVFHELIDLLTQLRKPWQHHSWLSQRTSVRNRAGYHALNLTLRNVLNWFKPLIPIKLTARVIVPITCYIFKALPHNNSWCLMQWEAVSSPVKFCIFTASLPRIHQCARTSWALRPLLDPQTYARATPFNLNI